MVIYDSILILREYTLKCYDAIGYLLTLFSNGPKMALAGVAQWIEHWPTNLRVAGLIPSQGTCLGCGPGPQREATTH